MAESIVVSQQATKEEKYKTLLPQLEALILDEEDHIANAANIAAALKSTFRFFWIGFYFVRNDELVLGPFQGPVACTRIAYGKGVCGTAWKNGKTIVVDDVETFPGHIACSAASKSEIVLPGIVNGKVKFVLDIDSDQKAAFDNTDREYLEQIVDLLGKSCTTLL